MRLGIRIQLKCNSKDASGQTKSLLDSLGIMCSCSFVDGDDQVCNTKSSLRNERSLMGGREPKGEGNG